MKTAPIIDCLRKHIEKDLIKDIRSSPFNLMVDGSNDTGLWNMFPISINIFYLIFNWIWTKFLTLTYLRLESLHKTNPNIGGHNSIRSRAIEKIEKLLFHVALVILNRMASASLLMPLIMWLILALKIIVRIFFTSLRSHPNGDQFWKNSVTSAIKTIRR